MSRQLTKKDILNAQEAHFYNDSVLYVVIDDDEIYGITEGSLEWFKKENFWDYFESSMMVSYFTPITKEKAVSMYESWKTAEPEKSRLCSDQEDASFAVYSSTSRGIHITVADKRMTMAVNDYGKECEKMNGKDEYEFYYSLEENETLRILKHLRNKHGYRSKLQSILKKEFGHDDGPEHFQGLCEQQAIRYSFFCY